MKVKISERIYQTTKEQAKGLLKIAKEQVKFGIYAIEKKGYMELTNMPLSITQIKDMKRDLKKQGYKVYCNYEK